jgi:putative component of toxin-antitoxin plasmid stabilization module
MSGKTVVLLLMGGDKSTQSRDVETAKAYWKQQKEK